VDWISDNYKWLFDGVGGAAAVAFLLYLVQRFFKSKSQPASQETSSTIAVGSEISQTVNSPTVHLNLGKSASEEIHQRRVEALLVIQSKLESALFYFQRAASSSKLKGEASDQELLQKMARDLGAASEQYSQNRLLISLALARKVDEFCNTVVSGSMTLNLALDPMTPNGDTRANLWKQAQEIAYKELPPMLEAIRTEARAVIHG
jgi:hypothetical protein